MINILLQFDSTITLFLRNILPHNTFFDYIFAFLSVQGSSIFVWIIIISTLLFLEEKRDKRLFIFPFIINLIAAFVTSDLLKKLFHRPRPAILSTHYSWLACPINFSFPSGHAATAFAAATFLAAFDPKRKWFYFGVAVFISFSRIYLNCHYFFDVIAGGLVGIVISKLILSIIRKLRKDYLTVESA